MFLLGLQKFPKFLSRDNPNPSIQNSNDVTAGWPQRNQWHVCRFLLPPSEFYFVVNRRQVATLPKNEVCHVRLQFVSFKGQEYEGTNLTEPFCLHSSINELVKGKKLFGECSIIKEFSISFLEYFGLFNVKNVSGKIFLF